MLLAPILMERLERTGRIYIAPIRSDNTQSLALGYNPVTKEVVTTTGTIPVGGSNTELIFNR